MSDEATTIRYVDFANTKSRSEKDPGYSIGVPLAQVISRKLVNSPEFVMMVAPRSLAAEMFRRLRSWLAGREKSAQMIAVTSAVSGESRAAVATNLALAFVESSDERVALVDADMRTPFIGRWIEPQPRIGLAEVLSEGVELKHAMHKLNNTRLYVLPAGTRPVDPMPLLDSEAFIELLLDLRERFDRIIVLAPPLLPFPDTDLIKDEVDGTLMVVKAGHTPRRTYLSALENSTLKGLLGTIRVGGQINLADLGPSQDRNNADYYKPVPSRTAPRRGALAALRHAVTKRLLAL